MPIGLPAATTPTRPDGGAAGHERARAAAKELEAVFLAQMLTPMFAGLAGTPPFGGGFAEATWRSLLLDQVGREISRSGSVGIADLVYAEILKLQGEGP